MEICEGRVVVITGAARGLGREYALGLALEEDWDFGPMIDRQRR